MPPFLRKKGGENVKILDILSITLARRNCLCPSPDWISSPPPQKKNVIDLPQTWFLKTPLLIQFYIRSIQRQIRLGDGSLAYSSYFSQIERCLYTSRNICTAYIYKFSLLDSVKIKIQIKINPQYSISVVRYVVFCLFKKDFYVSGSILGRIRIWPSIKKWIVITDQKNYKIYLINNINSIFKRKCSLNANI